MMLSNLGQLGNFKVVQSTLFPIWLGIVPPLFFILEVRKQFRRVSKNVQLCLAIKITHTHQHTYAPLYGQHPECFALFGNLRLQVETYFGKFCCE